MTVLILKAVNTDFLKFYSFDVWVIFQKHVVSGTVWTVTILFVWNCKEIGIFLSVELTGDVRRLYVTLINSPFQNDAERIL